MTPRNKNQAIPPKSNRTRWIAVSVILVLLLLIGGGWYAWSQRTDPDVARVTQMMSQAFGQDRQDMPQEERERVRAEIRAEMDKLTEDQRRQVWQTASAGPRRMMEQRINRYFELPESQRQAYLDEQIREMDARFGRRGNGGPPGGGPPGGGPPGDGPPRGRGGRDENTGLSRRRQMLDNTTPEQRAKFAAFFEAMAKRREELGLPSFGAPR